MCQIGSRTVGILDLVAQKSELGMGEAQSSLGCSALFLCPAFPREPQTTGGETMEGAP